MGTREKGPFLLKGKMGGYEKHQRLLVTLNLIWKSKYMFNM